MDGKLHEIEISQQNHCCMGTVIELPVPDWVKPSFVMFDICAL